MKKNLLLFVGALVASWLMKKLALYIARWNDYRDVFCGFSVDGQPNPDLYMQICPPINEVLHWTFGLSSALLFVSLIFVPVFLKHNNWVKWVGTISAVWVFLPFERISSMINHLAWTINPQWFINKEKTANTDFYYDYWAKWMDAFRFVENNWFWIVLGAVIVLSLISFDRKKNGIITRLTEHA